MSASDKTAVLLNLTEEQIAKGISKNLEPLIREQVNHILEQKTEDEEAPIGMKESAMFLKLSRTTFSKIIGKGQIPYKSLNPDNPKAKKFFFKKDLREWSKSNRSKTIDELKSMSYGKDKS